MAHDDFHLTFLLTVLDFLRLLKYI
jgi:hypothetical protein